VDEVNGGASLSSRPSVGVPDGGCRLLHTASTWWRRNRGRRRRTGEGERVVDGLVVDRGRREGVDMLYLKLEYTCALPITCSTFSFGGSRCSLGVQWVGEQSRASCVGEFLA
jgi:hypothetical protein